MTPDLVEIGDLLMHLIAPGHADDNNSMRRCRPGTMSSRRWIPEDFDGVQTS